MKNRFYLLYKNLYFLFVQQLCFFVNPENIRNNLFDKICLFQNVEDSFLSGSGSSKSIGARVREIVTENLKEPDRTLLNKSAEEAMAKSMQVKIFEPLATFIWNA